jgi:hypothetical protein
VTRTRAPETYSGLPASDDHPTVARIGGYAKGGRMFTPEGVAWLSDREGYVARPHRGWRNRAERWRSGYRPPLEPWERNQRAIYAAEVAGEPLSREQTVAMLLSGGPGSELELGTYAIGDRDGNRRSPSTSHAATRSPR